MFAITGNRGRKAMKSRRSIVMKLLKVFISAVAALVVSFTALTVSAQNMDLYVKNQYVERDVVTYADIDMLPIADIAGELGFKYTETLYGFSLYNEQTSFSFVLGSPIVYCNNQPHIGLDVVPMIINGRVRLPSTFFTRNLGLSYTWDRVTNAIFISSDDMLREIQSANWYQGYKKAAEGRLAKYKGSNVPDYGDLSGEELIYYDVSDGWYNFRYDYYEADLIRYVNYLEETGWVAFDEPYYDDNEIVFYYSKGNVSINVGAYADLNETYAFVDYIFENLL